MFCRQIGIDGVTLFLFAVIGLGSIAGGVIVSLLGVLHVEDCSLRENRPLNGPSMGSDSGLHLNELLFFSVEFCIINIAISSYSSESDSQSEGTL